jgi:hypothetical protein
MRNCNARAPNQNATVVVITRHCSACSPCSVRIGGAIAQSTLLQRLHVNRCPASGSPAETSVISISDAELPRGDSHNY